MPHIHVTGPIDQQEVRVVSPHLFVPIGEQVVKQAHRVHKSNYSVQFAMRDKDGHTGEQPSDMMVVGQPVDQEVPDTPDLGAGYRPERALHDQSGHLPLGRDQRGWCATHRVPMHDQLVPLGQHVLHKVVEHE